MRPLALSPHGTLFLDLAPVESAPATSAAHEIAPEISARIEAAFGRGMGAGLLHLGAVEVATELPPTHAFFRALARDFVTTLRAEPEIEALRATVSLAPNAEALASLAHALPPMRGAEYATVDVLASLWLETQREFQREIAAYKGDVARYLHGKSDVWSLVGRVFFHLAENKKSETTPFAFLATYTTKVSANAKPQHRPLGKALEEHAESGDRRALLALLGPVHRASESSALVKALVDSGELYHPLAWTPSEAHAFLQSVPALEAAGIVVRVPNWWRASRPPRPQVRVTVGGAAPSKLGAKALVDFDVAVTLGDEVLTRDELREILASTNGLVLVKGQWVEIDRDTLGAVLDHWKKAERAARGEGLTFLAAMRLLAGVRDGGAAGDEAARAAWSRVEAGSWLASVVDGLRSPEGLAEIELGAALQADLRPYQRIGVRWLWWLHTIGLGGVLADDMGLGKTIQVLALLLLLKKQRASQAKSKSKPRDATVDRPSLLVVPASLLGNWSSEAARFAPTLRILVAHPSAMSASELAQLSSAQIDDVDLVVTTYGTLARAPAIATHEWNVVVLDEAQAIKNPGAQQTRAVKALTSRTRIALTGTPVENRLGDLWSIFDFVSPGLLGTAPEFTRATKALAERGAGGYAPLRALVSPYILRRLKTDPRVVPDLPDKTEQRALCSLTKTQAALYAEAVASLQAALDDAEGIARRGVILAALMRFKQICNHPSQWLGDGRYGPADSGKLLRLRELCEPLAERQEKVLVFTQFREMTEPLARFLEGVFGRPGLVLHGGTPVKERKSLVDAFQAENGPPFFVLSLKAGGTGLNLTAASHVIHFDRWWNPAVENQATDRAHRIGQRRSVFVHKLVCRGTVEERIDGLIESKRALSDAVIEGGGESVLTELSNEALMRMVSLDLNAALFRQDEDQEP